MLPGTKYTPEDILRILKRRFWLVLLPVVVGSIAAYWYGQQLPNLYRSETLLMLMPQRISDGYVRSALSGKVEDRLTTLREQVLSRPNLEQIILDFNLYSGDRSTTSTERLVGQMNRDVTIRPEGAGSVRLTYTSPVPAVAQEVTERLAKLFVEENLRDRENVAEATNDFLDSQLAEAKERLLVQEKTLEAYRRRYSNELPSQAAPNLQAMQGTESRLRSTAEAADRLRQSRILVDRQLADLQSQDPVLSSGSGQTADSVAGQLDAARDELARLVMRNTEDHPDVRAQRRKIAELEKKVKAQTEGSTGRVAATKAPLTPAEAARQRRIRDLEVEAADIDRQLSDNEDQQRKLRADISNYESRLSAVPTRESELIELTRDYQTMLATYNGLSTKREESTLSANLERKNVGEQFRVLDPPRVPERPYSPNRNAIQLAGTLGGFALGLALIAFLEYQDATFKNEEEVFRLLELPVLAVIPFMPASSEAVSIKGRLGRLLAGFAGVMAAAGAIALWLWR